MKIDEQYRLAALVDDEDRFAARARHQRFGFGLLGALFCVAGVVFTQWDSQQGSGRWFWLVAGTLASIVCLVRSQRRHGGVGADRDPSPYYGIFAGVMAGAALLMLLTVAGWILLGTLFVMAAVLAFMAWIEQSVVGMTSALCVAVLCAGYGVSTLNDPMSVSVGSASIGVMLLFGAIAFAGAENSVAMVAQPSHD